MESAVSANGTSPPGSQAEPLGGRAGVGSTGTPLLEVTDLLIDFHQAGRVVRAVDGLSYTVPRARTVGLIGESGCGKTVSSRAIMALLPPSAQINGSIRFEGQELIGLSERKMRERPRQPDRDGIPGPGAIAQPDAADRAADHRGDQPARRREQGGGARSRGRADGAGPPPRRPRALPPVPPPALGRYAPAGDDRDRAGCRAQAPDRRRGHDGARRHHPGPDHGVAATTSSSASGWR